mmetsp:Transcript_29058/g.35393  ORF Transcript_29058/g.35393 Transcript_29058/m.35393 type:complete len:473 (+) Transcript_29058:32-1450(+)|eukprot:CAMPEP_0172492186 /NCGR_PEP_ID=MMETSP1066-20121228/23231_1 /TAXON_ID=671091 /ORGANISM="Coscinodiscus wailesii, Strain CCMP2513" /LENGTH=472 /DNA_ID=CAMNT_0013261653 /DNA_START=23 /DNA_END=1441 /DNA_ORIENTATION=+
MNNNDDIIIDNSRVLGYYITNVSNDHDPNIFEFEYPSFSPTHKPSAYPSDSPGDLPSNSPSALPSHSPSTSPSHDPSISPSHGPSDLSSHGPSVSKSYSPSNYPSSIPSILPSSSLTTFPSFNPSASPSNGPSTSLSHSPSDFPSHSPSSLPSNSPSISPSYSPSTSPSYSPSNIPSSSPSNAPTTSYRSSCDYQNTTNVFEGPSRFALLQFDYEIVTATNVSILEAIRELELNVVDDLAGVILGCERRILSVRRRASLIDGDKLLGIDSKPDDYIDEKHETCVMDAAVPNFGACTPVRGYMTARICSDCDVPEMTILLAIKNGMDKDRYVSKYVLKSFFIGKRTSSFETSPKGATSFSKEEIPSVPDSSIHVTAIILAASIGVVLVILALTLAAYLQRRKRKLTASKDELFGVEVSEYGSTSDGLGSTIDGDRTVNGSFDDDSFDINSVISDMNKKLSNNYQSDVHTAVVS